MCIEFCALNANINLDIFPPPQIANLLDKLGKAKLFIIVNLATA